jgi:hypothetical protein
MFWDVTPCVPIKIHKFSVFQLHSCTLFSIYSTLKMEAEFPSETSVKFCRTTLRHITEYSTVRGP